MSITQTFQFDNEDNFTFSSSVISSNQGKLEIIDNPGQVFSQDFSSSSGFTYDPTKAAFGSGSVSALDQRPSDSIAAATYTSSKDLNWITTGSLSHTNIGTTTLVGGKLQCLSGNNGVYYGSSAFGTIQQTGTLRCKYTPNYSGTPSANIQILSLAPPSGSNNVLTFFHSASGGSLRLTAQDTSGASIWAAVIVGTWSPTSGTEYELEVDFNLTGGATRIFINGVQLGSTLTQTATRGSTATRLYVGAGVTYAQANASFNDVVCYSTALHTSNYTPGYTLPETSYVTSTVALPAFSYTGLGTIQEVESSTITEAGIPHYLIAGYYFNGSSWVLSDGSYTQSNTSAAVIANLTSLVVAGSTSVVVSIIFPDSNTQASVDLISVTITGQKYSATGYIEPVQALQVKDLISYTQSVSEPTNTSLKVALKIDGALTYYNGSAWVVSDGTASQANTPTQLNDAFDELALGSNSSIFVRWILTTTSNTATPTITTSSIEYNYGAIEMDPEVCVVYGYIRNISAAPIVGAKVTFTLVASQNEYNEATSNVILGTPVSAFTDENGYFSLDLIRSSAFEGSPVYQVVVVKGQNKASNILGNPLVFEVPDAETKDITDLLQAS